MTARASSPDTHLDQLQRRLSCEFPAINRARQRTVATAGALRQLLSGVAVDPTTHEPRADLSVVVYGSLARQEWTQGSDVDWTLLIDGRADPCHQPLAQKVARLLDEGRYNKPGPTGVFGNMTISHDLFNKIGGLEDTNENTTQRILLLLESRALTPGGAYDRVIELILQRYLLDDRGLLFGNQPFKVPRYLINDIVRYWRTIGVDFVDKQRGRGGKGWALRNAKLRLSRKLIFVAGLLTCFGCEMWSPQEARAALSGRPESRSVLPMARHLRSLIDMTPLSLMAFAAEQCHFRPETARGLFAAYDGFLAVLDDEDKRSHLSRLDLDRDQLTGDTVFAEVSRLGRDFQDALTQAFFKDDPRLAELTMLYGVF